MFIDGVDVLEELDWLLQMVDVLRASTAPTGQPTASPTPRLMTASPTADPTSPRPTASPTAEPTSIPTSTPTASDNAVCWGRNHLGQATVPADLGHITAISAGQYYNCAIQATQSAVCWGIGDGDNYGQATVPANLGRVTAISGTYSHTCAIQISGNTICWGYNHLGQATVPGNLGAAIAIVTGGIHTCVIQITGYVMCWGHSDPWGQATAPGGRMTAISAGYHHNCAIQASARNVICWGYGLNGETAVPGDLGAVTAVAVGRRHSCAIQASTENAVCWGQSSAATVPGNLGRIAAIAAGQFHTCAIQVSGNVTVCWGDSPVGHWENTPGSWGRTTVPATSGEPPQSPPGSTIPAPSTLDSGEAWQNKTVSTGNHVTCVRRVHVYWCHVTKQTECKRPYYSAFSTASSSFGVTR